MEKSIHSKRYKVFLTVLRDERTKAGLSQEELADRIDESQSFVSKCERGERRIDVAELLQFCMAIGSSFQGFCAKFDKAVKK